MTTTQNLHPLFTSEDSYQDTVDRINRFLARAERDHLDNLASFKERLEVDPADAIAWNGEGLIQSQYRLVIANQIRHLVDDHPLIDNVVDAAVLVVYEEQRSLMSRGSTLANSTGHGHRMVDMATNAARAKLLDHDIAWRLGLSQRLSQIIAHAEGLMDRIMEDKTQG